MGLRHNEKLYEELLIGNDQESTTHPKIFRAREEFLEWNQLRLQLFQLKTATKNNEVESSIEILRCLVHGFVLQNELIDNVALGLRS